MAKPVRPQDVVWTYSGVRPLFDDGDDDPSAVTRDYHLEVDAPHGAAPMLSVFGGKITTYRRLAEHALEDLRKFYPAHGRRLDRGQAAARRRARRCADLRGRRSTASSPARPPFMPQLPHESGADSGAPARHRPGRPAGRRPHAWPISAGTSAAISTRPRCAT